MFCAVTPCEVRLPIYAQHTKPSADPDVAGISFCGSCSLCCHRDSPHDPNNNTRDDLRCERWRVAAVNGAAARRAQSAAEEAPLPRRGLLQAGDAPLAGLSVQVPPRPSPALTLTLPLTLIITLA